ncbi:MAG: hypothetical protein L3K17_08150 [Thermoplasmata archaeon]|nr:hypothetical protein [Thermoplasmata archaeon]
MAAPNPAPTNAPSPSGVTPGAWAPPATWAPPPGPAPRGRRTGLYVAVAAVAVAVLILLSLAAVGVLPWFSNPPSGPEDFASARQVGQSAANGYPGGPWTLVAAAGVLPSTAVTAPLNGTGLTSSLGSGCLFTPLASGNVTVQPAQNVSRGTATEWLLVFRNSADTALIVSDNARIGTLVGTITGTTCTGLLAVLNAIPSTAVDSTTAVAAADADGGYAFLRANPGASAAMAIIGGYSVSFFSTPGEWLVEYSTCALSLTGTVSPTSGMQFLANVSMSTGAVLSARTANCTGTSITGPPPPPSGLNIAGNLVLSPPTEMTAGANHWYNFSIQAESGGILPVELAFGVVNASYIPLTSVVGSVAIYGTGGGPLASYSIAAGAWTSGGMTALPFPGLLSLETTLNLSGVGDQLVITGVSPASGSVLVGIP